MHVSQNGEKQVTLMAFSKLGGTRHVTSRLSPSPLMLMLLYSTLVTSDLRGNDGRSRQEQLSRQPWLLGRSVPLECSHYLGCVSTAIK
jgi:hypothetical protein